MVASDGLPRSDVLSPSVVVSVIERPYRRPSFGVRHPRLWSFWFWHGERIIEWILFIGYAIMLVVAIVGLVACAPKPIVVEKVVTVPVKVICLTEAAPTFTPVARPKVCMPGFLCFEKKDAIALSENVEALKSWVARVWNLCGGK